MIEHTNSVTSILHDGDLVCSHWVLEDFFDVEETKLNLKLLSVVRYGQEVEVVCSGGWCQLGQTVRLVGGGQEGGLVQFGEAEDDYFGVTEK